MVGIRTLSDGKKTELILESDGLIASAAFSDLWTEHGRPLRFRFKRIPRKDRRMIPGWGVVEIVFLQLAIHIGVRTGKSN